jgi:phosphopantetheinyl transferase
MSHNIELYSCQVAASDLAYLESVYLPRLHIEEAARYQRFSSAQRRLEWLSGRALALKALTLALGEVNDDQLRTGNEGNIVYPNAPIHLSLSHRRGLLALTIATVASGVDVEQKCMRGFAGFSKQVFSPIEALHVAQTAESERALVFYRYWTLKEAVCKAAGLSIWEGLTTARFDLRLASAQVFTAIGEKLGGPWRFWSADIDNHWHMAIAVRAVLPVHSLKLWRMGFQGARTKLKLAELSSFASL